MCVCVRGLLWILASQDRLHKPHFLVTACCVASACCRCCVLLLLLPPLPCPAAQQTTLLSRMFGPRGGKVDDITVVVGLVV